MENRTGGTRLSIIYSLSLASRHVTTTIRVCVTRAYYNRECVLCVYTTTTTTMSEEVNRRRASETHTCRDGLTSTEGAASRARNESYPAAAKARLSSPLSAPARARAAQPELLYIYTIYVIRAHTQKSRAAHSDGAAAASRCDTQQQPLRIYFIA